MTLEEKIEVEKNKIKIANEKIDRLKMDACLKKVKIGKPYTFTDEEEDDAEKLEFIFIPQQIVEVDGKFHIFGAEYYHCDSELSIVPLAHLSLDMFIKRRYRISSVPWRKIIADYTTKYVEHAMSIKYDESYLKEEGKRYGDN